MPTAGLEEMLPVSGLIIRTFSLSRLGGFMARGPTF